MVIRYKPGSCFTETEVFTNQRKREEGEKTEFPFLRRLARPALRWPVRSEWVMSAHLCEAVPCPPARRELDAVKASTLGPAVNGQHRMTTLIHQKENHYTEKLV